jgi:outer membrane protein assembly factor BamB
VHRFVPSAEPIAIRISRPGCAEWKAEHRDDGRARLVVDLERAPLAAGALLGGLDRAVTPIPGYFLVPCRDGRVYALPDSAEVTQVARRVFVGGQVGHPSARVAVSRDAFAIAGFDGEVSCVAFEDWATRWTIHHDAPVIAATALPGGHYAIGDERGRVIVLDRASGREIARTQPSFPVEELAVRGDILIAIDRAHHCRTFELPRLALLEERVLPSPIAAILPDGALLLVDGTRSAFEGSQMLPPPGTAVVERSGRVLYGSVDGRWVEFDGTQWNAFPAPTPLSCAPLRHGDCVFLGCADGRVHCVGSTGAVHWTIGLAAPPADLIATSGGHVLALLRNGQLILIEGKP